MKRIVLTEEQAKLLSLVESVEICTPEGRVVSVLPAEFTPEEWEKLQQSRNRQAPRYSSEQVRSFLTYLDTVMQAEGSVDPTRSADLYKAWREQQP